MLRSAIRPRWLWPVPIALLGLMLANTASAFEFFDGRLQVHGFYESQIRALNEDFGQEFDVAQWYNVLDVEFEMDLIEDTIGPIDLLQGYVRLEARYDCIYSHGCGMFRSMNTYGDRASNLPKRLSNGREFVRAGAIKMPDDPDNGQRFSKEYRRQPVPLARLGPLKGLSENALGGDDFEGRPDQSQDCFDEFSELMCKFFSGAEWGPPGSIVDDTFAYVTRDFADYRFTQIDQRDGRLLVMGPWLPKNKIYPNAILAKESNPFDKLETSADNPILFAVAFSGTVRFFYDDLRARRRGIFGGQQGWIDEINRSIEASPGWPAGLPIPEIGGAPAFNTFNCATTDPRGCVNTKIGWNDPAFGDPADWDGYTGNAGNWATAIVSHVRQIDPPFDVNSAATRDPSAFVAVDKVFRFATRNGFTPFNSLAPFERGALEFATTATYAGALPFRPVTTIDAGGEHGDVPLLPQGAYYPSPGLRETLRSGRLDPIPFNISEQDRAFNRGDSQSQTKELKEAYLDVELLDSRLWLRLGKQTIVWGKTELFSFSDQFNPQDFALASLPSLEESRIALWSARGVYSLYNIGPLDDVRIELAMNYDENQPADLGACGEAFTVNAVCALTFGLFAHGFAGVGVAGIDRPPDPWDSAKGIEVGGRLEFRWDRFSFSFSDFYGYSDIPTIRRIQDFERNVDSTTGLVRRNKSNDPCTALFWLPLGSTDLAAFPGGVRAVGSGCLTPGPEDRADSLDTLIDRPGSNALLNTSNNLQLFAVACFGSGGVTADLDPGACGVNVFNSVVDQAELFHVADVIGAGFAGTLAGSALIGVPSGTAMKFVRLSRDQNAKPGGDPWDDSNRAWSPDLIPQFGNDSGCIDTRWSDASNNGEYKVPAPGNANKNPFRAPNPGLGDPGGSLFGQNNTDVNGDGANFPVFRPKCGEESKNFMTFFWGGNGVDTFAEYSLAGRLSPEQEALLGCGPFFGINCNVSGIDLLNADISVFVQSFPGLDGTEVVPLWRTDDASIPQPGTVNFRTWTVENDPNHPEYALNTELNEFGKPTQLLGAPRCTTNNLEDNRSARPGDAAYVLPGCRGLLAQPIEGGDTFLGSGLQDLLGWDGEIGYFTNAQVWLFHPFDNNPDPQARYPDIACTPFRIDGCNQAAIAGRDEPEWHNRWEPGYDIRRDGNPLGVAPIFGGTDARSRLQHGRELFCRLPGNAGNSSVPFSFVATNGATVNRNANCNDKNVDPLGAWDGIDYSDLPQFLQATDRSIELARPNRIVPLGNNGDRINIDGTVPILGPGSQDGDLGRHPFTGQVWQNELAALSWNFMMTAVANDDDFERVNSFTPGVCSFVTPQYCGNIRGLFGLAGLQHRKVEAGGNGTYGRRAAAWHAGGQIILAYDKRNVIGAAVDFAEDRTKTNWSLDFTWIDKVPLFDANQRDNISRVDQYNLTISVDRPTFVNFLNPNNTFFINSQWFISYFDGWRHGVKTNGPWNILGTVTALTGYFQDRLNGQTTLVYDFKSTSGGVLPQVNYRINQDFTVTVGAAIWFGHDQLTEADINPIGPSVSSDYRDITTQSISNIRDRDELFLRIRYTF